MKKNTQALLILALSFFCLTIFAQTKNEIAFTVKYTNTYCGGAQPTPEILEQLDNPQALTNTQLLFVPKDGKSKKAICATTDKTGQVNIKLLPGTYSVKMSKKFNKALGLNYNPTCKKMLDREWQTLEINKDQNTAPITLRFSCNPCEPAKP
jgi:L-rhamnose isomerase